MDFYPRTVFVGDVHFYHSNIFAWCLAQVWRALCVCLWLSSSRWVREYTDAGSCVRVSGTPVSSCIKRGCVSNCDCSVTHSCTAGHAFYAGSCCTVSRWHSWRKNLAPDNACCCRPFFLWAPSPSLSLGSYPAEEQDTQKHRGRFVHENWRSLLLCLLQHGWVWHRRTVSQTGCAREDEEAACTAGKRSSVSLPYLYWRSPSSCSSENWESSSPWCPSPPSLHDPPHPHSWSKRHRKCHQW